MYLLVNFFWGRYFAVANGFYLGVRSILLHEKTEKTPIARVVTVWYACPSFHVLGNLYRHFSSNFVIVSCFAHKLHLPTGQDCLGENISQEKLLSPNIHASWWFHLKKSLEKIESFPQIWVLKPPPPCVKHATFPKQIRTIQRQFVSATPWITFFLSTTHGATTILALNFGSSIPPQLGGFTQQRCWKIVGIFYEQNVSKRSYEQKSQSRFPYPMNKTSRTTDLKKQKS